MKITEVIRIDMPGVPTMLLYEFRVNGVLYDFYDFYYEELTARTRLWFGLRASLAELRIRRRALQ